MIIEKIEYKELFTGHDYDNYAICATATVEENESPAALEDLKKWVRFQLKKDHDAFKSVVERRDALHKTIYDLERRRRALMDDIRFQEAARTDVLQEEIVNQDIPF